MKFQLQKIATFSFTSQNDGDENFFLEKGEEMQGKEGKEKGERRWEIKGKRGERGFHTGEIQPK